MAAIGISLGTNALKVGLAMLAQHSARLAAAKNENAALDTAIPGFDQDLQQIATAYNAGQVSAPDAITALQTVDQQIFSYLYSLVGKAGTAWGGPTTTSLGTILNPAYSADCNKRCTAACCVYLNDLRPAIYGRSIPSKYLGLIEAIQQGGGIVTVPKVSPPSNKAYGNYEREAYQIAITQPPIIDSAVGTVSATVSALFGGTPAESTQASVGVASPLNAATGSGLTKLALLAALFFAGVFLAVKLAK